MTATVGLHVIRVTLAVALAVLVGTALGVGHLFWVLLTVPLVMTSQTGESVRLVLLRIAGTLVGAVAAYGLLSLIGLHRPAPILVLLPVLMMLVMIYMPVKRFLGVVLVTVLVVMLFTLLTGNALTAALQRVQDTTLGALIALGVVLVVAPSSASQKIRRQIPDLMRRFAEQFQLATAAFVRGGNPLERKEAHQRVHTFRDPVNQLLTWVESARWETIPGTPRARRLAAVGREAASLLQRLSTLYALVPPQPVPEITALEGGLTAFADGVAEACDSLARAAEQPDPALPPEHHTEDLRVLLEDVLAGAVVHVREEDQRGDTARRLVAFYSEALDVLDDLEALARTVQHKA